MNRRDFLHPRHFAETAGQLLGALHTLRSPEPPCPDTDVSLVRVARSAMATTFEIMLPCGLPFALQAAQDGLDLIDRLEAQLTVYRESSAISYLNRHAAEEAVPVEEKLFELLTLADRLTRETDGAFDITAGALIKAWGFYRRAGRVPTPGERQHVLERTGMRHVILDPDTQSVRYGVPGLEINLGSIGKGYALDRVVADWRDNWNIPAALLHGGHSSVYAIGSEPGATRGWAVGIRHPWDPEKRLAVLRLCDRGLGTSSSAFQHLEYEGRKLGHILDPRTGWPAETLASASVAAPTAAEADALATAFFILGAERARAYCEAYPEIGAVLLPAQPDAPLIVLGNLTIV
jgi:thiamine biosynthesis lipoprotein